jgi:hypothetical protein
VLVGLYALIARFFPIGPDYFYIFRPTAERVLGGGALYEGGYYNAPWGLALVAPTVLLPIRGGQAVFTMVTLVALLLSTRVFAHTKAWMVTLAVANLHTFDLIIRGNLDGFLVLGVALSVWAAREERPWVLGIGLWLLSVKPVNVALPAAVLVWATRRWDWREKLAYLTPTASSVLVSLAIFGWWPARYVVHTQSSPPLTYLQTSAWRAFTHFDLSPRWALLLIAPAAIALARTRDQSLEAQVVTALSASLLVTPYSLGSHYVLLAPVPARLVARDPRWAGVWLLTLTPLLRLVWGFDVAWVDMVYPLALLIGVTVSEP